MTIFFHIVVCVLLIVFQTAVLPVIFGVGSVYDILLPMVAFLGLYRPFREGLTVVVFSGVLMDTLSGGPFGLFTTVYLWLFLAILVAVGVVQETNRWFGISLILVGVVLENLTIMAVQAMAPAPFRYTSDTFAAVAFQMLQAAASGVVLLWCIRKLHGQWEIVVAKVADYMEDRRLQW